MIEGVWTVQFNLQGRLSSMVLTVRGDSVSGGNTEYFYIGKLNQTGERFSGSVVGQHYFGPLDPLLNNASRVELDLVGTASAEKLTGKATLRGFGVTVSFEAVRRGE